MDLTTDRLLVLAQAVPTASSGNGEQGPSSAPILVMTLMMT